MTKPTDIADHLYPLSLLDRCPAHRPTSLQAFPALAGHAGCAELWVKMEAERMGLGSFKALGGAYAIYRMAEARILAETGQPASPDRIIERGYADILGRLTVCCASAGNHGLSVATGARLFGFRCEIMIADTVSKGFAERLRKAGATVIRAGATYEDALAVAAKRGREDDAIEVSDTTQLADDPIPLLVMQGYSVMAQEMAGHFANQNSWPTHIALQAGVGGMAAAVAQHIQTHWPVKPRILIFEPDRAPCIRESALADDSVVVSGPESVMGRLDCKEASRPALNVLRRLADDFITISDAESEAAAAMMTDAGCPTTPSGAAGYAGILKAGLGDMARVLVIATEGPAPE